MEAAAVAHDLLVEVKLTLMRGIDSKLRTLYSSQLAAEEALDVTQPRLSALRNGQVEQFSIPWLILLAQRIGAKVTVSIE
jgi:predicted XRE-type DNA-binding protein